MEQLIGVGLYTPAEAGRLLHVSPAKISRWLRGHDARGTHYESLWTSQVEVGDGKVYLGFRDLMEVRIADKFIGYGMPPQRIRAAIRLAREVIREDRPLSTDRFRTDGRDIFLRVAEKDEQGEERERLLNLFRRQYEFKQIIEPLLKTIDFDDRGAPLQWWPLGKRGHIVLDPARSFGQPIDSATSVPTAVLAAAGRQESLATAARIYEVPPAAIQRAIQFEAQMSLRAAV